MSGEVIHNHQLTSTQHGRQYLPYIYLEDLAVGRTFYSKRWPIPSMLMLQSSVVFLPRLRGTEQ